MNDKKIRLQDQNLKSINQNDMYSSFPLHDQ